MARSLTFTILFLSIIRLSAQQKGEFVLERFVSNSSDTLPFQLIIPSVIDSSESYPMVLWLHGKGERGKDNQKQMTLIKKWLPDSLLKDNRKAFLLAPQCSETKTWNNYDKLANQITFDTITPEIQKTIIALMDSLIDKYSVDTTRIYIMGISMGGFGVFDMITRFPDRFAAAIPICGGGDPLMIDSLQKTPIWAFHGENDKVVDKRHTVAPMKKLQNGNHILTTYPGVGHDSWNKAFKEPELLKWMFEQHK